MSERMQILVTLDGSAPPIQRRLLVDPRLTLTQLHVALQHAFDWADCHLHEFHAADGVRYASPSPFHDHREDIERPDNVVLRDVLGVDAPMDYVYDFGDGWTHRIVLEAIVPVDEATRDRLLELAGRARSKPAGRTAAGEPPAVLVESGERAAPPEDCGGIWGYHELLQLMAVPPDQRSKLDEWDRERLEWVDDHDPEAFDLDDTNRRLARLRVKKAFIER